MGAVEGEVSSATLRLKVFSFETLSNGWVRDGQSVGMYLKGVHPSRQGPVTGPA